MSSTRRKIFRHPTMVNIGCGCRRPKLSSIFNPKPKNKLPEYQSHPHSSTSLEKAQLSIIHNDDYYYNYNDYATSPDCLKNPKQVRASGRVSESVAVVKDSDDPYLDFRHSMLQMILEKEIYGRDDLRELLDCFLSLNSPYHHEIIVQAFTEIWNGVYSAPAKIHGRPRSHNTQRLPRARCT